LVTPRAIIVRTPLIGHEIDLSSALLREMQNNTAVLRAVSVNLFVLLPQFLTVFIQPVSLRS
jgi:hypothetical protein